MIPAVVVVVDEVGNCPLKLARESMHRIMSSLSEEDRRQLWSYLVTLQTKAREEIGMEPLTVAAEEPTSTVI